jgi:hypothetical protein
MQRYFTVFALLAVAILLSISGTAQAPPSADAYVTNTQPAANFGDSPLLAVQAGTTSYIRLNLGMVPANASIAKATLRLYVNAVSAPGRFDVYQVQTQWAERTISSVVAPQLGPSATGGSPVSVTAATQNQFLLIDITPLVQSWVNGSAPNNGIALALTSTTGSFSFDSKESSGTGHYPEIELSYESAASTPSVGPVVASGAQTSKPPSGPLNADPYIDNGTVLQTGANFNIDGNGTAATLNATGNYNLAGTPVLGNSGTQGMFVGAGAGQNNTGSYNLFLGIAAGYNTTAADFNTFIGTDAGYFNTTGTQNFMLGATAGYHNTTGSYNMFVGSLAGYNNTTGTRNAFVGRAAGIANTTGTGNSFFGANAGSASTANFNTFLGGFSGTATTTGAQNTLVGWQAGQFNVAGSNNLFLGYNAGSAGGTTSNNDVYVASPGAASETGVIRIGDPASQTAAYIAGIYGNAPTGALPVVINANGQLGTTTAGIGVTSFNGRSGAVVSASNDYSFSQINGTLGSSQLSGAYGNAVTLSNPGNAIDGSFAGNGAGLTGVPSGLAWPIVTKSANYTILTSDFSTPTTVGNFLIATGTVSRTFTLPNPAPANGDCVAIGNVIDAGINSGTNTILTVNSNGLMLDATVGFNGTHPRRAAYLYCSDGTDYYRLGYTQNAVDDIGPWLKTLDTGGLNAMTTTFRNGMDLGFGAGVMFYILPANANTVSNPTLNVNGFGARPIVKFGNHPLAPNDLTTTAYAHLFYDGVNWQLLNPQTAQGTVTAVTAAAPLASSGGTTPNLSCPGCTTTVTATYPLVSTGGTTPNLSCPTCFTTVTLTGTTASIGGTLVSAGTCANGTATVSGATVGHPVAVSAADGTLPSPLVILSAAVTGTDTITVQLCAVADVTPSANTYNVMTQ